MVRDGGKCIKTRCKKCGGWLGVVGLYHPRPPFPNAMLKLLQSSHEVLQKECGVVLPFAQRQPGHLPVATSHPCADQRGFAKASGGSDEGQFAVQTLVQPLEQARAADNVRPKPREIQFRGENRRRHEPPTSLSLSIISTNNMSVFPPNHITK